METNTASLQRLGHVIPWPQLPQGFPKIAKRVRTLVKRLPIFPLMLKAQSI